MESGAFQAIRVCEFTCHRQSYNVLDHYYCTSDKSRGVPISFLEADLITGACT